MSQDFPQVRVADEVALAWAMDHFRFQEELQISVKPWGVTYRLRNPKADAFLKILPQPTKSAARTTPRLGERFSGHIPEAIASDEERGLLLLKDHRAKDLSRNPNGAERLSMIHTYAHIQAQAALDRDFLNGHPRFDLENVVAKFVEFLRPGSPLTGIKYGLVSAEYFLGTKEARRYYELFEKRSTLLAEHVATAKGLPDTINHLDLRPSNAAIHEDGACVLYDWDESLVGPAGLSLHNVFREGLAPIVLLANARDYFNPDEKRSAVKLLTEYLEILVAQKYATQAELRTCLGGSVTAGMMHYVTGFSQYPEESASYKSTIASNIKHTLSELLNICDYLTIQSNDRRVFDFAREYSQGDRGARAKELIEHYLHRNPLDPQGLEEQGRQFIAAEQFRKAIVALGQALQVVPEKASLHTDIATAYTAVGDFESAIYHLARGRHLSPNEARTQQLFDHVSSLQQSRERAGWTGTVPMVDFTDTERTAEAASPGKLQLCVEMFQKYGILQLNNIFDKEMLRQCHAAFLQKYDRYLKDERHKDALKIGNKRLQVTIDLVAPFDNSSLFSNGLVLPLLRELLSEYLILGAYTSSMSLPGAEDQPLHKDHKALFPEDESIKGLPSFAISVMIPLIDVDERVGTTCVKKATHLLTTRESEKMPTQSPIVDLGSCYLMDYRLSHYGQANQSQIPRPILNILYQRAWFKDFMNFKHQPPVRVSKERFETLAESQQKLLEWTQNPSPAM